MKKMSTSSLDATSKLNEKGGFAEPIVKGRHRGNNQEFPSDQADYMDVSPKTSSCRCDSMFLSWKR